MGSELVQENPSHFRSGQRPRRSLRHTEPSVMRNVIAVPSGEGEVLAILRVDRQMGALAGWAKAAWAVSSNAAAPVSRTIFIGTSISHALHLHCRARRGSPQGRTRRKPP